MTKIVKGNVSEIPAELLNTKTREHYDWENLEIGDHAEFTDPDQFTKVRSSINNFAKGSKERSKRNYKTRVIMTGGPNGDQKTLEVWRLPDPVIASNAEVQVETTTAEVQPTISEIPGEIDPPDFKGKKNK